MKLIRTQDAVGQMLCHDLTRIVPGEMKGPVFKKGHIVTEEDIPVLLSIGKDNLYVWEVNEHMVHENDAAWMLYRLCENENMHPTDPSEGKIEAIADCDGLLKVDSARLYAVNALGEMMIATRHGGTPVHAGDRLAGMRVIPLIIEKEKMERAQEAAAGGPILTVLPYKHKRVGIVTTGNEVFYHRIEDKFTPVLLKKLAEYDTDVIGHVCVPDEPEKEIEAIRQMLSAGADIVLCTGGMSVDPDDRTPFAIRSCADEVITYGAPVLPGAMFMLAYADVGSGDVEMADRAVKTAGVVETAENGISDENASTDTADMKSTHRAAIVGLPGCVMYARRTIFDLVLPHLCADDALTSADFAALGEGGLCLGCETCTWPNCGFGK